MPLPPPGWDFASAHWPDDDCVAAGADLEPSTLVDAYRNGLFPMPDAGQLLWWCPLERGVLEPGRIRISRSLRASTRRFTVTVDQDFEGVVAGCADPRRPGAWIAPSIARAYQRLHELGWAHSIEVRDDDGALVGGLYGVAVGHLFAGESMFHRARDASKVALVRLVELLESQAGSDYLVDTQWQTPHLATLGVSTMTREAYLHRIGPLTAAPPLDWTFSTTG
ncbi:leucyl/phenylalanyl-tRNA--protein transferase [Aeromicrobium sp. PE09-221]|nr:leucyl/phenylalanyl-tRNA--protein transferase [Aeromicrobium sp. PE09-221]